MLQHEDLARAHLTRRLDEASAYRLARLAVRHRREREATPLRRRLRLTFAFSR